jgi:hypothetical protein
MRKIIALLSVCLAAEFCLAQEAKFDLSKKPALRPGDVVASTSTSNDTMEIAVGGKVVQTVKRTKQATSRDEVLAVNASGAPTELRVTMQSAQEDESAAPPGDGKKTSLRDLIFTVKRDGNQYVCDTSSLLAKDANALRASQIALLKDITKPASEWDGYPERDIDLMPRAPVTVGHEWEPSADALKKWTEDRPLPKGASVRVRGAKFKLTAAEGKVAVVEGNVSMTISETGADTEVEARLTCRIDTQTGRWLGKGFRATLVRKQGEATVKMEGASRTVFGFTPGAGKPSPAPEWKNKIGWAKPGPDTNSFQEKEGGISLNVPKDFKPVEVEKPGSIVARFAWQEAQASIAVTLDRTPTSLDLEDLVPAAIAGMKESIEGYKVLQQTPLTLPNNVPAMLLTATAMDGKLNLITIMGIDAKRCVSVTAGAQPQSAATVEKLTAIVKTLRVFDSKE